MFWFGIQITDTKNYIKQVYETGKTAMFYK